MLKATQAAGASVALGIAATCLLISGHICRVNAQGQARNERPVVKITAPDNNSVHPWNTLVNYNIVVTDRGKSTKYQEIPSKQVVLTTTYVPDLSQVDVISGASRNGESAGLQEIAGSDCIGCHQFRAAAMGPSFATISERYRNSPSGRDTLAKYIREGSANVWGQAPMPAHPQFTEQQLSDIAGWILKDAATSGVNYYVGTEGTFQMDSPKNPGPNAGLVLAASYSRQDAGNESQRNSRGEDTILIKGR
jgi:cytochrome c